MNEHFPARNAEDGEEYKNMKNSNITEEYYNSARNAMDFYERTINYDLTSVYKPFIEQLRPGGHILDAGCGPGRDILYFIKNGFMVTGIDASEEMVKIASGLTGRYITRMRFQEIDITNEFDGIWANASLLHVNRSEMHDVLIRLFKALKNGGVFYATFKYGNREEEINGRLFNFYDEDSWNGVIKGIPGLAPINVSKCEDNREDHKCEYWLHILIKKVD